MPDPSIYDGLSDRYLNKSVFKKLLPYKEGKK